MARFIHDSARQRQVVRLVAQWTCLALLLAASSWLLATELPGHLRAHSLLAHLGLVLSIFAVPLVLAAAFARTPMGRRRFKRRYIVRAFHTVRTSPTYDGERIAEMLYRHIVGWGPADGPPALGQGRVQSQTVGERAEFSYAGAQFSVSIAWLAATLRYLITGYRDVTLGGILHDEFNPPRIRVWQENTTSEWAQELDTESFGNSLDVALNIISLQVLEALAPIWMAQVCWARGQYAAAIRVLESQEFTAEVGADIVEIELARSRPLSALHRTDAAEKILPRRAFHERARLWIQRATALVQMGRWSEAQTALDSAWKIATARGWLGVKRTVSSRAIVRQLRALECEISALKLDAAKAREAAAETERTALQDLRELAPALVTDDGIQVVDRVPAGSVRDEIERILWSVYGVRRLVGESASFAGEDPSPFYERVHDAVLMLRALDSVSSAEVDRAEAMVRRDAASSLEQSSERAQWNYLRATDLYEKCIAEQGTRAEFDPEDLTVAGELGWSHSGKLACVRAVFLSKAENATTIESECEPAADWLGRLVDGVLSEGDRTLQAKAERLARQRGLAVNVYRDHVLGAVGELIRALIDANATDHIREWLDQWDSRTETDLRDTLEARAREMGFTEAMVKSHAEHSAPSMGAPGWLGQMYWVALLLLNALVRNATEADVRSVLEIARTRRSALAAFGTLMDRDEDVCKGEALYGYACLHAMRGDLGQTVACLEACMSLTAQRAGWSLFRNRARCDADFTRVRRTPEFRALIYDGDTAAE